MHKLIHKQNCLEDKNQLSGDCTTSATPDINKIRKSTILDIHHVRHPLHQTSTTQDNHHTVCKLGHPPHRTSTTQDNHHTMCKLGYLPNRTSITPDIHHTEYLCGECHTIISGTGGWNQGAGCFLQWASP